MPRNQAEWMCTLDERLIERVAEDSLSSPRHLERTINFNASLGRIKERLAMLTDAGLVAPIYDGAGMYEVTGEGQRYLKEELDAEHLPRPNPHAV
jgi:hypothetical protein